MRQSEYAMTSRTRTMVFALLLCALLSVAGMTLCDTTAHAQSGNTIYACYAREQGSLRRVDQPGQCRGNEIELSWNIQGPAGPQGLKGDKGDPGVSVTVTPVPPGPECANGGIKVSSAQGDQLVCNGMPGPPGPNVEHGFVHFSSNGSFQIPDGITHVQIEIWGGGGGGGFGPSILLCPGGDTSKAGGGGGSGAHLRKVVDINMHPFAGWPERRLDVRIGSGGAGGTAENPNGGEGETTIVWAHSSIPGGGSLIFPLGHAAGGKGGVAGGCAADAGSPGLGAILDSMNDQVFGMGVGTKPIQQSGNAGTAGTFAPGVGGQGFLSVGHGGRGGERCLSCDNRGLSGQDGYVIITY